MNGRVIHALIALLAAAALLPVLAACGGTDTVVIATVGNYPPLTLSMRKVKSTAWRGNWGTSCAAAPI